MRIKDLLNEAVSYEFGGDAYRQRKDYDAPNYKDYVDYTDLIRSSDLKRHYGITYEGKKYISVYDDEYAALITGDQKFEVYQFDENGENPKKIKNTDGLYSRIEEILDDMWLAWNEEQNSE